MNRSIPPLLLERAALGELDPKTLGALQARFGPGFENQVAQLRQQNEAWAADAARNGEIERLKARLGSSPERRPARAWIYLSLAACTSLLLFVVFSNSKDTGSNGELRVAQAELGKNPRSSDPSVRFKGLGAHLTLHRKRGQGQEQLRPGSVAKGGDLIQLSYVAARSKFGVIVSIDGNGHATLHYPGTTNQDTALESDGAVPLEQAYELDHAPHFERFFFVHVQTARPPKDFARRVMMRATRFAKGPLDRARGDRLPLPETWSQSDFLLNKPKGVSTAP